MKNSIKTNALVSIQTPSSSNLQRQHIYLNVSIMVAERTGCVLTPSSRVRGRFNSFFCQMNLSLDMKGGVR